jgi:endonuclease III
MRETLVQREQRTKTIIQRLKRNYPDAHCALDHGNPLELLLATILSAQCTDERVNLVTKSLFKRFQSAADYAAAPLSELEEMVRSTGFFRAKAKNIQTTAKMIVDLYSGQVPRKMEQLTALPGVGRKTANVVLGNAFGVISGVVVDTHVKRLAFRMGLTREKVPEKVETDLQVLVPCKDWILFSHLLITHGRKICKARTPECSKCFLADICPKRIH